MEIILNIKLNLEEPKSLYLAYLSGVYLFSFTFVIFQSFAKLYAPQRSYTFLFSSKYFTYSYIPF